MRITRSAPRLAPSPLCHQPIGPDRASPPRYPVRVLSGVVPVTALTRCAVALATLPLIASHHPDAVVVWFDAHADINTLPGYVQRIVGSTQTISRRGCSDLHVIIRSGSLPGAWATGSLRCVTAPAIQT